MSTRGNQPLNAIAQPTFMATKSVSITTKLAFIATKRAQLQPNIRQVLVMVMLYVFESMNLWFNSFTFLKL